MPINIDFSNSYFSSGSDKPYYFPTERDESGDPRYYGFTTIKGNWYIVEDTASTGALRYASGKISFTTNWTNRASLSYSYPYELFS